MKILKEINLYLSAFLFSMVVILTACSSSGDDPTPDPDPDPDPDPTPDVVTPTFAKGADLSWATEMEDDGMKFYNSDGTQLDCFQLMSEVGMNAVRLRVWVNPENAATADVVSGGYGAAYCDRLDVLEKAKRAQALGMSVMIDFHYSDLFADPSRQVTPAAWKNYDLEKLKLAVADHTKDILYALTLQGITPAWIQIGNETRNGMLHPKGQLWDDNGDISGGWANFAALVNAGYTAAKTVCPNAKVMVHLDNAYADNAWWFDKLVAAGAKFDMIGLSHYPMGTSEYSWKQMNSKAIANIKTWAAAYGVKIMVCEIGVDPTNSESATCVSEFMKQAEAMSECAGVFYWEPEVYGSWRPKTYINVWNWGAYGAGALTSDGRPTEILDAFNANVNP